MNIEFAPRGILQIDDARIIFRNFRGEASKYNSEGDRNFALIIPDDETAKKLIERGWNVKIKPPREEGEDPFRFLHVKVKFNEKGPAIYLRTNGVVNQLDEESVGMLDNIDILSVDMDIRPYHWKRNGETGISAYVQSMCVTQRIDRFAERFANEQGREPGPNDPF